MKAIGLAAAAASLLYSSAIAAAAWQTYVNERFGLSSAPAAASPGVAATRAPLAASASALPRVRL